MGANAEISSVKAGIIASGEGGGIIAAPYFILKNRAIGDRILLINSAKSDLENTIRDVGERVADKGEQASSLRDIIRREKVEQFGPPVGAGKWWKEGENAAKDDFEKEEIIRRRVETLHLDAGDSIFWITTLGGGTGSGSIPYIIEKMKCGLVSVNKHFAIAIWPDLNEDILRHFNAICGLSRLLKYGVDAHRNADMVILIDNTILGERINNLNQEDRYFEMNTLIAQATNLIASGLEAKNNSIDDFINRSTSVGMSHATPCLSTDNDINSVSLEMALNDALTRPFFPVDINTSAKAMLIVRVPRSHYKKGEFELPRMNEMFSNWVKRNMVAESSYSTITCVDDIAVDTFDVLLLIGGFKRATPIRESFERYYKFKRLLELNAKNDMIALREDKAQVMSFRELEIIENNLKAYIWHIEGIHQQKREGALEAFNKSKSAIDNIKKLGISVEKSEELIVNVEAALKASNYEEVIRLSKQTEEEALKLKKTHDSYIEASNFISSNESEIAEIKNAGIKTQKSDKVIEQAQSELKQNNFEKARQLANEAKRIALERKEGYSQASDSLEAAESVLNETKDKGVVISIDSLTKTKQAFDTGDYEEAKKISEELQDVINTTAKKYSEAQEELKSADSSIEKAKEFGCNVLDFEDRLTNVEPLFDEGAYEEVIETSKQIGELVKKIREEAKPEIKISLSQTSFKPNAWKRIDNIITNTGSATAKAIKVDYPKERVEIDGLMAAEDLKPNEEKTLKLTVRPIQEGEVPLTATITYMDLDNKEYKGEQSFWITVGENVGEKGKQITTIEIKRSFVELPNNDLKFGILIINKTEYMIADVKTILDYPRTLLSLKDNVVQTLANISPNGKRTAKYILTPLGCIHNEKIDAIISYNDHTGKKQTVQMRPKEVHCVCPFLKEKVIREGEFAELANTCERIEDGLSFSGIGVTELTVVIKESCAHRLYVISEHEIDSTKIVYLAGESIGEKAYYLLTAVIRQYKDLTQVALRAYSDKPYGLHGFLNEIASSIRHLVASVQSTKEIGIIESKQVINIIDYVVQHTSFGVSGEGTTSVNIEGSVVQRTEIGSTTRCPDCGKEVQTDEKFCTACGAQLE